MSDFMLVKHHQIINNNINNIANLQYTICQLELTGVL